MTELEIMQHAKMYLDKLARGIDPITDREVPEDTVLNNVRLARCFFYVSGVLGQVIANDGYVGAKPRGPKLPEFSTTTEELSQVLVTQRPVRITQFVDRINTALHNPQMKKLGVTIITDWLLSKGFLEKCTSLEGKSQRLPTEAGTKLGLTTETRQGQYGVYTAVFYSAGAQQFVLDNLPAILEEKRAASMADADTPAQEGLVGS